MASLRQLGARQRLACAGAAAAVIAALAFGILAVDAGAVLLPLFAVSLAAVSWAAAELARRERDALHDRLTGLPNRELLTRSLARALQRRATAASVALLLVDLDRFKQVNEALGHDNGDQLLRAVGVRLAEVLRPEDLLARMGGDEFAVLLRQPRGRPDAEERAALICRSMAQPFEVAELEVDVGATVGLAMAPDHGDDPILLVQRAEVALRAARGHGWAAYDPERDEVDTDRLVLLSELRQGIARGELVVHFQPKVEVRTGRVSGAEALVRWQHPEHGLLHPASFLGHAEHTALMEPLTRTVLNAALEACRSWHDAGWPLSVAVNLSVRSLHKGDLVPQVAGLLGRWGVDPDRLILEITESTLMADPEQALAVLTELHRLGVHISIDDFGTGYSSLAYLKLLPFQELKIDRAFVTGMDRDVQDATIVRCIIELAHQLGHVVVAEGVESQQVFAGLRVLGCDQAQGFHLSPAVAGDELLPWVERWTRSSAII